MTHWDKPAALARTCIQDGIDASELLHQRKEPYR
jgi:hypothetical protein